MKAALMTPSKFLKKEDVEPAKLVTIKALRQTNVAMDDQPEDLKWTLHFRELDKPMVLNSTNIQLCTKALGTDETDEWIGKQIVVFNDPNVSFAGKITGGIRIRARRNAPVVATAAAAAAPAAAPPAEFEEDNLDDVPF